MLEDNRSHPRPFFLFTKLWVTSTESLGDCGKCRISHSKSKKNTVRISVRFTTEGVFLELNQKFRVDEKYIRSKKLFRNIRSKNQKVS